MIFFVRVIFLEGMNAPRCGLDRKMNRCVNGLLSSPLSVNILNAKLLLSLPANARKRELELDLANAQF